MSTEIKEVLNELKAIKLDLSYIMEHMVDVDTIMTLEEGKRFNESMKELKEGKTAPLKDVKKELGI